MKPHAVTTQGATLKMSETEQVSFEITGRDPISPEALVFITQLAAALSTDKRAIILAQAFLGQLTELPPEALPTEYVQQARMWNERAQPVEDVMEDSDEGPTPTSYFVVPEGSGEPN